MILIFDFGIVPTAWRFSVSLYCYIALFYALMVYHRILTEVTRRVPLVDQELFTHTRVYSPSLVHQHNMAGIFLSLKTLH